MARRERTSGSRGRPASQSPSLSSCGRSRADPGRGRQERRRHLRLEPRVSPGKAAIGRAHRRRIEARIERRRWHSQQAGQRRARLRRTHDTRGQVAAEPADGCSIAANQRTGDPPTPAPDVPCCCNWYRGPGVVRRCARPSPAKFGTDGPFPFRGPYIAHTPDRDKPGTTWGVGHGSRKRTGGLPGGPLGRSEASIRTSITSRITDHRPAGPGSRNGRTHRDDRFNRIASRVSGGDPASGRFFESSARGRPRGPPSGPVREDPPPSRRRISLSRCWRSVSRRRRTMPRRSRSSRRTRAAATRPASRVMVEAIQSMYDGSNAATSPSVWPRNLPNSISTAQRFRQFRYGSGTGSPVDPASAGAGRWDPMPVAALDPGRRHCGGWRRRLRLVGPRPSRIPVRERVAWSSYSAPGRCPEPACHR